MNKIASFLVACISLSWLYKGISSNWEFLIPAAIFALCTVFLYKGSKIAKWSALALVVLNIIVNKSVIGLIERGQDAASPIETPIELQISTALCLVALLFLLASFWLPKSKSV